MIRLVIFILLFVLVPPEHRVCSNGYTFAGADSVIEGKSVYTSRLDLGKRLADRVQEMMNRTGWKPDIIVCPVPDTSRPSTIALAEVLKVSLIEKFLSKSLRATQFYLNTQEARERAVQFKLSPIVSEIEGETFYLLTTVSYVEQHLKISRMLRKYGAKSVAFDYCPPLRHPCFYGIDFSSSGELSQWQKSLKRLLSGLGWITSFIWMSLI